MSTLFKELNWRGHPSILVLNAPPSFEPEFAPLQNVPIHRDPSSLESIAFVTPLAQVEVTAGAIALHAPGDPVLWLAYPKGTSKRYTREFNRDNGWASLGAAGFEPVRMVAIEEDWSALCFRRVDHITFLPHDASLAVTEAGKARTTRGQTRS